MEHLCHSIVIEILTYLEVGDTTWVCQTTRKNTFNTQNLVLICFQIEEIF